MNIKLITAKLTSFYCVFIVQLFLVRAFFIYYNYNYLSVEKKLDWINIFIVGLRFDLVTIGIFMFPFSFLYCLYYFFKFKYIAILKSIYFHVSIIFLILINTIDTAYYKFNFRRSTIENFNMFLDIKKNIIQIFANFPIPILAFFILVLFHFYIFYKFKCNKPIEYIHKFRVIIIVFLFITSCMNYVFIRGFKHFTLTPSSVSLYTNANYTPIICNTFQTFFYSLRNKSQKLKIENYLTPFEANSRLPIYHSLKNDNKFDKKNVVIFILESFSRQYLENGNSNKASTPFLDSLMKESLVCTNAFANGSISVNGVQNILSGIPAIEAASIISSNYAENKVIALPEILKKNGYLTAFFHGAENDLFGFKRMTQKFGIDEYYSELNLKTTSTQKGLWGIHDEYFFDFSLSVLNKKQTPFFASIFNISSHDPYNIPEVYKKILPKGKFKAQQSISYVDYCLQKFFINAKKEPWFQNTLFVFVADHWNKTDEINSKVTGLERYKIPLFFHTPINDNLKGTYNFVIDQNSIYPSILDLLNYNGEICSFGKSIKDTINRKTCLMYQYPNVFEIINDKLALQYDNQKNVILGVENYKNLKNIDSLLLKETQLDIQAFIQVYSNAVIKNQLVPYKK